MLREEAEEGVRSLKAGKSPGVDNVPFNLLKIGDEARTTVMTADMPENLGDEGISEGVDIIACHTFTKEGHSQAMS